MRSNFLCLIALSACSIRATPLNATTSPNCKCIPGDSCWLSTADFSALNNTLSGHLVQGVPPAIVCYSNEPQYNEEACKVVLASWFSSTFHATNPISVGNPWWANNTCPPIYHNGTSVTGDPNAGSKGCSIGGYPVYSVNATEEAHVVAAVKFAKERNIRLNVKSTGHSYQGRSTAFGSLSVWTHNMRGIEYHESFEPSSCPLNKTQMAFTIAAGERIRNLYEAANEHQAIVVAGSAQDVGIVGHFSSGGHGPLSSTYGLSADNVLEIRIVTPDGEVRTANPCTNPDLFWALRGGGGGTFGVVTSVTMKAYPSPQSSRHTFSLFATDTNDTTAFWDTIAFIMSEFPRLKEGGLQGYSLIIPPGSSDGTQTSSSWGFVWGFNIFSKPNGTIGTLFAPVAEKLNSINGTSIVYQSSVQWYPSFFALWNATIGEESVATSGATLGSRLLPASSLTDQKRLSAVLKEVATVPTSPPGLGVGSLQAYLVANNQTGRDGSTSMTPAWGDAVLHFIVAQGFPDNSTFAEAQPVFQDMKEKRIAPLKSLAPESGSYQNEADPFDSNWQYDFFGTNYARLKKVKQTYDPDSLLWCISCVGSEEWAPEASGRLCRVPWAGLEDDV